MRIALYYMHYESLGHTARVRTIANLLKKQGADVLVIEDGKPRDSFRHTSFAVKNFPFPSQGREVFHGKRMDLSIPIIRKRLHFLQKELDVFKPDIFITEFFPFGRKFFCVEMGALLSYLKEKNPQMKIYASIGYPYLENEKVLAYAKHYDKILIHCPPAMDSEYVQKALNIIGRNDLAEFHAKVFSALKKKIIFTNYVIHREAPHVSASDIRQMFGVAKAQKLILVSRGGGPTDPKIITVALQAARTMGDEFFFLIISGPSSSSREEEIFHSFPQRSNVKLLRFYEHLPDLLNACDVSVSMAGYNTALEALWLKKQSILIPREPIPDAPIERIRAEQFYRALMLHEICGNYLIPYRTLQPSVLRTTIENACNENKNVYREEHWFDSEETILKEICSPFS